MVPLSFLLFEASRHQEVKCGRDVNRPFEIVRQADGSELQVAPYYGIPQPNPLQLPYWIAGVATLIAPPIVVAIHSLKGYQLDDDEDPETEDQPVIAQPAPKAIAAAPSPAALLFGDDDDEEIAADDEDEAFADFDRRLTSEPAPIATPPAPNIDSWMAAIALAQPRPPIAPPEPIDLATAFDDTDDDSDDDDDLAGASNVHDPWTAPAIA